MKRHRIEGELVTFKDARAFHHDGILYHRPSDRACVVHVHGSFGNFYQNEFIRIMAGVYRAHRISLLSFNLAGHDALAEGYRHEWDFEYAGAAITSFGRCVVDIQAALDFVRPFSKRVVLQGHSIGCDRVLHFLIETGKRNDFVMLSPCDSYRLQCRWLDGESIETQISRLKRRKAPRGRLDWLPSREYGIWQKDWRYSIPITRSALLSIMRGPPYKLMRIDRPMNFTLSQRALVYIGGDDALQTSPREDMLSYLRRRIVNMAVTSHFPEGDHSLWGCESEVAREIADWVRAGEREPVRRASSRRRIASRFRPAVAALTL